MLGRTRLSVSGIFASTAYYIRSCAAAEVYAHKITTVKQTWNASKHFCIMPNRKCLEIRSQPSLRVLTGRHAEWGIMGLFFNGW